VRRLVTPAVQLHLGLGLELELENPAFLFSPEKTWKGQVSLLAQEEKQIRITNFKRPFLTSQYTEEDTITGPTNEP